jgi:hypothetical protein
MNFLARLNLHTRISLVLTGLAASLLLVLAGIWLQGARTGIHEEVEAASRVSEQWLSALTVEMQTVPAAALADRVLGIVKPLGRIRANALEVFAADGRCFIAHRHRPTRLDVPRRPGSLVCWPRHFNSAPFRSMIYAWSLTRMPRGQ